MHPGLLIAILFFFCAGKPIPEKNANLNNLQVYGTAVDSSSCIIPFNRVGNLIVVRAKVDSIDGNFILDTGAAGLVLNITYFRDYETTIPDEQQSNITGSSSPVVRTSVGNVSLGSFNYSKMEADLVNLGNIENSKGIKVIGLLGIELFKACEMIIDFKENLIYLRKAQKKDPESKKHESLQDSTTYWTFPVEINNNRLIVTTQVPGKKLKLVIDCAAESNMLDSRLPDKVFENLSIVGKVKLVGVGNKKVDALLGNISNMRMGEYDMGNMLVTVSNLERSCFSDGGCDGVLGSNFLSMHKIGFNFVKREFYIWK